MVDKKEIETVLNEIISNFKNKCQTIATMKEKLSGMTYDEQYQQLKENNYLNPYEDADYQSLQYRLEYFQKEIEADNWNNEHHKKDTYENFKEIEEELFQYGRRLIEGMTVNEVHDVDISKFKYDNQIEWDNIDTRMGDIERNTISSQKDNVKVDPDDVSYRKETYVLNNEERTMEIPVMNDKRLVSMDNYFNGDCNHINYTISHKGYLKALDDEQRKHVKNIDSLMNESKGLSDDTILYRSGTFDIHLRPGDHNSFKGYQSTTFQEETAYYYRNSQQDEGRQGVIFRIHAPKGTKGISGNDDRFNNGYMEHEYVLPRNTGYSIMNIDYDNNIVDVILD